jgi:nucleotide-binding universal stress UspA family protein
VSEPESEFVVRRILVALDVSKHSLAALEAAVRLAASMEAELLGIFVEDLNLLRVAALRGARQICYPSAIAESLDLATMERDLRVRAEQARKALSAVAERAQVPWSFRVVRGQVASEVLAAAPEADLLILGKAGGSMIGRTVGSTARAVAAHAPRNLLFVERSSSFGPEILAVYDGSTGSRQALGAAARLASAADKGLTVLIAAQEPNSGSRLEREAAALVQAPATRVHYRRIPGVDVPGLARAVKQEGGGVLVLSGSLLGEEATRQLLSEVENPVLLVGEVRAGAQGPPSSR